jgi:hypothetical protein
MQVAVLVLQPIAYLCVNLGILVSIRIIRTLIIVWCQFCCRIQADSNAAEVTTRSGVPSELPRIHPTVSILMHGRGHFKRSAKVLLEAVALSVRGIYRPGERDGTSDGE